MEYSLNWGCSLGLSGVGVGDYFAGGVVATEGARSAGEAGGGCSWVIAAGSADIPDGF